MISAFIVDESLISIQPSAKLMASKRMPQHQQSSRACSGAPHAYTLGSGSFGKVLLKYNKHFGAHCIKQSLNNDRRELEFLSRERLTHRNIVTFYANVTQQYVDGCIEYAMEFCNDNDLHTFIEKKPCGLDDKEMLTLLNDLSAAVDFLHRRRIYHGDIKPKNIGRSLTAEGVVYKLLDFGSCVCLARGMSTAATVRGSPPYMHPVLLSRHRNMPLRCCAINVWTADLWSVAVTILHALLGRLPFCDQILFQLPVVFSDRSAFERPQTILVRLPTHCTASMELRQLLTPLLQRLLSTDSTMTIEEFVEQVQSVLRLRALLILVVDRAAPVSSLRTRTLYNVERISTLSDTLVDHCGRSPPFEPLFVLRDSLHVTRCLDDHLADSLLTHTDNSTVRYADFQKGARLICFVPACDTNVNTSDVASVKSPFGLTQYFHFPASAASVIITLGYAVVCGDNINLSPTDTRLVYCIHCALHTLTDVLTNAQAIEQCLHALHLASKAVLYPRNLKPNTDEQTVRRALSTLKWSETVFNRWRQWSIELQKWRDQLNSLCRDYPHAPRDDAAWQLLQEKMLHEESCDPSKAVSVDDATRLVAAAYSLLDITSRIKADELLRRRNSCNTEVHSLIRQKLAEVQVLHEKCARALDL